MSWFEWAVRCSSRKTSQRFLTSGTWGEVATPTSVSVSLECKGSSGGAGFAGRTRDDPTSFSTPAVPSARRASCEILESLSPARHLGGRVRTNSRSTIFPWPAISLERLISSPDASFPAESIRPASGISFQFPTTASPSRFPSAAQPALRFSARQEVDLCRNFLRVDGGRSPANSVRTGLPGDVHPLRMRRMPVRRLEPDSPSCGTRQLAREDSAVIESPAMPSFGATSCQISR